MTEEQTTTTTTEAAPLPCVVRHPDAGGQCGREAAMKVHGLPFCEAHGEEARIGALLEEHDEIWSFVGQFCTPHVSGVSAPVAKMLQDALERVHSNTPSGADQWRALRDAYPNAPEDLRERIIEWEAGEEPGYQGMVDSLLNTLHVIHRCMRVAHEARETWLVETLERERESMAAEAAVALELADRRRAEHGAARD